MHTEDYSREHHQTLEDQDEEVTDEDVFFNAEVASGQESDEVLEEDQAHPAVTWGIAELCVAGPWLHLDAATFHPEGSRLSI